MKPLPWLLPIFLCSLFVLPAKAGDIQYSSGIGHIHGGLIGTRIAYIEDNSSVYVGVGLVGISLGVESTHITLLV